MAHTEYNFHPDLKNLSKVRLPSDLSIFPAFNLFLKRSMNAEHSSRIMKVRRKTINGYKGTKIDLLIYEPEFLPDNAPCLVYFHGGGLLLKATPTHYRLVHEYALKTPCKVIMVDYSLVPEVIFPTPVEECYKAYIWTVKNARYLNIDVTKIAVGGDSSGGGMATSVCLMARDRHAPMPCFQMLIYPAVDRRMETMSMKKFYDTPVWNSGLTKLAWSLYTPVPVTHNIEYASPAEAASLSCLPDAYIETAEYDCLHDEAVQYAGKLRDEGIHVLLYNTKQTMHGFDTALNSGIAKKCIKIRTGQLRDAFDRQKEREK